MHRVLRGSAFTPTALVAAALSLALGDLAGLLLGVGLVGRVSPIATAALQLACGLACVFASRPAPGARGLVLASVALVGLVTGVRAGVAAAGSCAAALEHGSDVVVAGVLLDRMAPDGAGRGGSGGLRPAGSIPIRIGPALVLAGGRRCRLPEVRARVRRGPAAEAGRGVVVRGVWRRYPAGAPRAPSAYGSVGSAVLDPNLAWTGRGLRSAAARWRGALGARLERRLGPRTAPLGKALVLADRTTLDPAVRARFVDAGILHLLAISGLHIGLIGAGLGWILSLRIRGPRRWPAAALLVGAYVAFIGAPPSAVRAAIVFAGFALAAVAGRPRRPGDFAALAGILALLADPIVLLDPGFQLSFAGFAGVLHGRRFALGRVRRGPLRGVATAAAVSLGAFLATAPIAALHFDRIVPASLLATLATTGLVALAVPAVALSLVMPGPLWMPFASSADALLRLLDGGASLFAALPLSWAAPAVGPLWWGSAALAAVGIARGDRTRRSRAALATAGLCAGLIAAPGVRAWSDRGEALFCHLAVGQGDAAVLRTPGGRWLLFDAGPGVIGGPRTDGFRVDRRMGDAGRRVIVPFLRARGARTIELLALSHPHLDHFGGSGAVFDAFDVRRVLDPGVPEPSAAYLAFLDRADAEPARWLEGGRGDRIVVDGAAIEILWPNGTAASDANEGSLSFRLEVAGFRYVNTGDAPAAVERAILAADPDRPPGADVVKLGHHGSRTSTRVPWLRALRPRIAVISAGPGNAYGHPHAETLARLDSAGVPRVWRTDVEGTLCIAIDPAGWRVVDP